VAGPAASVMLTSYRYLANNLYHPMLMEGGMDKHKEPMKLVAVRCPEGLWRELKILAAQRGETVQTLLTEAVTGLVAQKSKARRHKAVK
jgi:hypothetical protein